MPEPTYLGGVTEIHLHAENEDVLVSLPTGQAVPELGAGIRLEVDSADVRLFPHSAS
jgi:hypothetical protein